MNTDSRQVVNEILAILKNNDCLRAPKFQVETLLTDKYPSGEISAAIDRALDDCLVVLVLDDYPQDPDTDKGGRTWFLKLLSAEDAQEVRELTPLKRALLRLIYIHGNSDFPGRIRVEDAMAVLKERGFDVESLKWGRIKDHVERVWETEDGERSEWFRLIPEDEKTEEFKRAEEERVREWEEWDALKRKMIEDKEKESEARERRRQKRKKAS